MSTRRRAIFASAYVAREEAADFVERELGLTRVDLTSKRKGTLEVVGRALFVWIVKTFGPPWLSYSMIGRWLGGRDHSTIQHTWKDIVPRLREGDPDFLLLCDRFVAEQAQLREKR